VRAPLLVHKPSISPQAGDNLPDSRSHHSVVANAVTAKPHDALFKAVFGTPAHADELFRSWLPHALTSAIAWQTLASEPVSFIDSELNDHHSDLLFSARTHEGQQVLLYMLLEHQSRNDRWMPFRMLVYLDRIWERHLRQFGGPFPLIIPVVVSHAPEGWTAPRNFHELIQPSPASFEGVSQLVPEFTMLIVDLAHLTNEELKARALAVFPKLALWALRDARDAHKLLNNLEHWAKEFGEMLESPSGIEAMSRILRYLALVCEELHYAQFRAKLREALPEAERLAMTIAEELIQQGRAEGRVEGRMEGRVEGQVALLVKQLVRKFGELSADTHVRIEAATPEQLEHYAERILFAETLAAVFADD
jgi:predicted transposase/invertase (TIGR01784 family)